MNRISDSVKTANSLVRTIIFLVVAGVLVYGAWSVHHFVIAPSQSAKIELEKAQREIAEQAKAIEEQKKTITEQKVRIEKLEIAKRLLKVNHRLARVTVDKIGDLDGQKYCDVRFKEVTKSGEVIGKEKKFRINGDEIRIDCWIVKFEDEYIEKAELNRGTSLCVFKKIYGNLDAPANGHSLEEQYSRPEAYARGSKYTDFEKEIWDNFWSFANNPGRQKELGIRANHGQVNYIQAETGKTYEINLRSSDGLTIKGFEEKETGSGPQG